MTLSASSTWSEDILGHDARVFDRRDIFSSLQTISNKTMKTENPGDRRQTSDDRKPKTENRKIKKRGRIKKKQKNKQRMGVSLSDYGCWETETNYIASFIKNYQLDKWLCPDEATVSPLDIDSMFLDS